MAMSNEWPRRTVLELQQDGILLVEDGNHGESRPRPDEFGEGEVSFIRAADMADGRVLFDTAQRINEAAVRRIRKGIGCGGDVLLSHKGTVGKVALVSSECPPFVCSPQTTFWRTLDQNKIDRRFLYAFLCSSEFRKQLDARANETDMAGYVSLTAQRTFEVPLPPIELQRSIGDILCSLDDKIELNRRMNATLESMAQAIFKSWFIDFDPVHRNEARQTLTTSNIAEQSDIFDHLFPDSFEESVLGMVPKEWRVGPLSDIAEIIMGTSPKSSTYNDVGNGLPLINGPVEFGDYFPLKVKWTTASTKNCKSGDLIFCVGGSTTGRSIVADGTYGLGRGVCSIRSRNGAQEFVNRVVFSQLERLLSGVTGSVFPSLSTSQINDFKVLQPTIEVSHCFTSLTSPLINLLQSNVRENGQLSSIRDTLLSRLLLNGLQQTNGVASLEMGVL